MQLQTYSFSFSESLLYLCSQQDYDADDLLECQKILLEKCDLNQDGKINKEELTMVLTSASKNSMCSFEGETEQGTVID